MLMTDLVPYGPASVATLLAGGRAYAQQPADEDTAKFLFCDSYHVYCVIV